MDYLFRITRKIRVASAETSVMAKKTEKLYLSNLAVRGISWIEVFSTGSNQIQLSILLTIALR
jgi:hypothetical protein